MENERIFQRHSFISPKTIFEFVCKPKTHHFSISKVSTQWIQYLGYSLSKGMKGYWSVSYCLKISTFSARYCTQEGYIHRQLSTSVVNALFKNQYVNLKPHVVDVYSCYHYVLHTVYPV